MISILLALNDQQSQNNSVIQTKDKLEDINVSLNLPIRRAHDFHKATHGS